MEGHVKAPPSVTNNASFLKRSTGTHHILVGSAMPLKHSPPVMDNEDGASSAGASSGGQQQASTIILVIARKPMRLGEGSDEGKRGERGFVPAPHRRAGYSKHTLLYYATYLQYMPTRPHYSFR